MPISKDDESKTNDDFEADVNQSVLLQELRKQQAEARRNLVIWKQPLTVLHHFLAVVLQWAVQLFHYLMASKLISLVVLPALLVLWLGHNIPGTHQQYTAPITDLIELAVWWVGLGVLSSVGLGTGMHSGMLFLFPHIAKVCLAAHTCQSLNFATHGEGALQCPEDPGAPPTFFGIFLKVWLPCFLWGSGTALGEIPPYAISYAAAKAGAANDEFDEWNEPSKYDVINRMKDWMFTYLQKWGFWAILAFASWPNMAFDLCGLACGHFMLPFWTFFGATWLGKGVIKVNMQAIFFIVLFTDEYLVKFEGLVKAISTTAGDALGAFLQKQRDDFTSGKKAADASGDTPLLARLWGLVMVAFIGWFLASMINSLAQQHAAEKDAESNEHRVKKQE